jgi:GNAT superfamily N-acetyltransferase
MPIDADTAASAVTDTLEYVDQIIDRGWVARHGEVFAWRSGLRLPNLNGVLVEGPDNLDSDNGVVGTLLDRVAAGGLPYCLQARPAVASALGTVAAGRGMAANTPVPLMVLESPEHLVGVDEPPGLVIRRAEPSDTELVATVGAAGFEAPVEIFRELVIEAGFDLPGMRGYLGYCDGQPVATGFGLTLDEFVFIGNICTVPSHRSRGFGTAMTATAVADGLQSGARWAWLQSSPAGRTVYRRLGFRDIEEWAYWVKEP